MNWRAVSWARNNENEDDSHHKSKRECEKDDKTLFRERLNSNKVNQKPINTCENVNFMQNLQEIMWLKTENERVRDMNWNNSNNNTVRHSRWTEQNTQKKNYTFEAHQKKSKTLWIKYIDFDDTKILSAPFFFFLFFVCFTWFFCHPKKKCDIVFSLRITYIGLCLGWLKMDRWKSIASMKYAKW